MRLKEIRESKGLKQNEVALGLNLSPSLYNRYENGTREVPNALLPVMANFFGVTVDELFGRESGEVKQDSPPRTPEARILASWVDNAPEDQRKKAVKFMELLFETNLLNFKENDDDDTKL